MKQKLKVLVVLAVVSIITIPLRAAYEYNSSGDMRFVYSVSGGKATLTAIERKSSDGWEGGVPTSTTKLTIPSKLGGYPLVTIKRVNATTSSGGFYGLQEIVVSEGVETVGTAAFTLLDSLQKVTFPGTLTKLDKCFSYNDYIGTVIFNTGTGNLTLADNALCRISTSDGVGPSIIIFHRNAPTSVGNSAIPWGNVGGTTVWVRPNSTGWGVAIPGKWNRADIKYLKTIDFDATVGTVSAPTRYVTDGSKVGTLPTPTCPGGTFNGWYTAKSGGEKITASTTVSANKIFYAQWTLNKYTVSFDLNGGEGNAPSRTREWGTEIGALPTPTRTGATFTGWFTAATGGTKISASTTISANQTFYAHWSLNSYMITFDACEGTGGSSRAQTYGTNLGSLPVPTRSGYLFCGWFTAASGGTQINESTRVDGERTYYAHWERDPIPELTSGETVADALSNAVDSMLSAKIKTKKEYSAFRSWVEYSALVHRDVKESPNAWLAYALDAPGLIAKPSAIAKEDFTFAPSPSDITEPGKMTFGFGIDGVTIGEEAELDEVFAITGAATLEESAFTESGVTALLERTGDGKVSVSVEPPKDGNGKMPDKYFFRVKVK